jgi:transcriptional regulator of NAD metabolism
MEGILYVTDQNNKKRFVQIDLEKYGEMWEDFYDGMMAEMVKEEESISLEELGQALKKDGLIDEV